MIDFSGQTYDNLRAAMLAQVPNTFDQRDTAPIPTALSPAAWALAGFYISLNQVQQQAFVQTAVGSSLDLLAVLGNITRYQASPAVRLGWQLWGLLTGKTPPNSRQLGEASEL